ncbi:hypothetical protein NUW54_g12997 [Trametes sanguinea]|uniref:Uncharacterized protein n=1 Tax=Trametes sanguinea TaxID=158606 RepID=A0ACC1MQQ7_9APHY|nr:hypothetical protein NUW54_g12997 [Trametes sanguinea]
MVGDDFARLQAQLLRGDFVHTPRLGEIQIMHDHLLRTDTRGNIDYFAPASLPASEDIMASMLVTPIPAGAFMIPTFCDLHLHAPQFLYQGTGLHLPLMEWLNEYAFKAEERLDSDPELAERVFVVLLHHPTRAQLAELEASRVEDRKWREALADLWKFEVRVPQIFPPSTFTNGIVGRI